MATKTIEHKPTNVIEVFKTPLREPYLTVTFSDGASRITFKTAGWALCTIDRAKFRELCVEFIETDALRRAIEDSYDDRRV